MTETCSNGRKIIEDIMSREDVGRLSPEESAHIKECGVCRHEYAKMQRLEQKIKHHVKESLMALPQKNVRYLTDSETRPAGHSMLPGWLLSPMQLASAFLTLFLIAGLWLAFTRSTPSIPKTSGIIIEGSLVGSDGANLAAGAGVGFSDLRLSAIQPCRISFNGYSVALANADFEVKQSQITIWRGHLQAEVVPGTPLLITTPSAEIRVTGTRFEVSVDQNGDTRVNISEGNVLVKSLETGETSALKAGDSASFSLQPPDRRLTLPHEASDATASAADPVSAQQTTNNGGKETASKTVTASDSLLIKTIESPATEQQEYQEEKPAALSLDELID